jgi:ankyrin repeat protein
MKVVLKYFEAFIRGSMMYNHACAANLDSVRDLLRRGANVNFRDIDTGSTALSAASYKGYIHVVRALLEREGVEVNSQNNDGHTALIRASWIGCVDVVGALLEHDGVDVNIQNNLRWTALTYASFYNHKDVVRALLNHVGVDVNIKDSYGFTALMYACYHGYVEVVRALLQHERVEVNITNDNGDTALEVARSCAKSDVVHLLEKHIRMKLKKRIAEEELRPREEDELNRLQDAEPKQDMEKKRRRQEWFNRNTAGIGAAQQVTDDPNRRNENCPSSDDAEIEQDQDKLREVMKTPSAEPLELTVEYIVRCIKRDSDGKSIKLGSGAFGDVLLAEDSCLPKKFAVKMMRPTSCDQETIEEFRKTFQTELSVSSVLCVILSQRQQ